MIEIMPESQGNVLGIKASGKLTDQHYKAVFIPRLEEILKEHDKACCLFYMSEDFQGWEIEAMWKDALRWKHKDQLDKVAVVGGPKWAELGAEMEGFFMKGQVKLFTGEQLQDAWDWIKG